MKVLFISHDSDLQGAEHCLLELVTHLDNVKIEPIVLLPWPGPLTEKLAQYGIRYLTRYLPHWIPYINTNWLYPLEYFKDLRARLWSLLTLIENEKIDLIYTNTTIVLDGAIAARLAGIPHVWHIHEYLSNNPDLHPFLPATCVDHIISWLSDRIIVPSHTLAKQRFAWASKKTNVVYNGIELETFIALDGSHMRSSLGIPQHAPVITWIGALSPIKDPITFIYAAKIIAAAFPDCYFLIIGRTADLAIELLAKNLIQKFALHDHCYLLGFRDDVPALLAASTIHVSTSTREVFPINLIEAMASAKPIVATRCGGPEEVVTDGETGFVVEPKNPDAIAKVIIEILNDPEKRQAMGEAGRVRAHQYLNAQAYAKSIEEIISNVHIKSLSAQAE